jgi:hypothetical protein
VPDTLPCMTHLVKMQKQSGIFWMKNYRKHWAFLEMYPALPDFISKY